jgi:hypothetical protein
MQLLRDYPGSLPSEIFYPIGLISWKEGTGNVEICMKPCS